MFSGLQGWHIIVIVVAIVLLFGAKRLPDAAKGIGHSLRIFKSEAKAMREQGDSDQDDRDQGDSDQGDRDQGEGSETQQAQAPAAERLAAASHDTWDAGEAPATARPQQHSGGPSANDAETAPETK